MVKGKQLIKQHGQTCRSRERCRDIGTWPILSQADLKDYHVYIRCVDNYTIRILYAKII